MKAAPPPPRPPSVPPVLTSMEPGVCEEEAVKKTELLPHGESALEEEGRDCESEPGSDVTGVRGRGVADTAPARCVENECLCWR